MATLEELKARLEAVILGYKIFIANFWGTKGWKKELDKFAKDFKSLPFEKLLSFSASAAEQKTISDFKASCETWISQPEMDKRLKKYPNDVIDINAGKATLEDYISKINANQALAANQTLANNISNSCKASFGKAFTALQKRVANNPANAELLASINDMIANNLYAIEGRNLGANTAGKTIVNNGVYTVVVNTDPAALCNQSYAAYLQSGNPGTAANFQTLKNMDAAGTLVSGTQNEILYNEFLAGEKYHNETKERTIIHESRHLQQAREGKLPQNERGVFKLFYDITDEVEAFQAEANVFGGIKIPRTIGQMTPANNITIATVNNIDQFYAGLPQVELSLNMRLDALLPNFPQVDNDTINTIAALQAYLVNETGQPADDFNAIEGSWTMIQVLDIVCTNGQPTWQNLRLSRTW